MNFIVLYIINFDFGVVTRLKHVLLNKCLELVIGSKGCSCLDNQHDSLYNSITDSDFEQEPLNRLPQSMYDKFHYYAVHKKHDEQGYVHIYVHHIFMCQITQWVNVIK